MRATKAGTAVLVAVIVVACSDGGSSAARSALVDYAQGDWHCEITADGMPEGAGLEVDATVRADSSTRGTFTVEFATGRPPDEGEWRLDGRSLEMDVRALSSYTAEGVDLDTDGIEILEDAPGSKLQQVAITRDGNTTTFSWPDPWTDTPTQMTCSKT
jgi:hypothetical protein